MNRKKKTLMKRGVPPLRSHQPKFLGLHILQLEGGKIYMYQIVLLCDKLMAMCLPGKLEKSLSLLEFKKKGWAEERQKQANTSTR